MAKQPTQSTYVYAVGRRKSATAEVRLFENGSGKVTFIGNVNLPAEGKVLEPLKLVGKAGSVDLSILVRGGGIAGQEDASALGVARALVLLDEEYRTTLKKAGYLTRDPRERERKKPGLKGARRSPQWSKR